MGRESSLAGPAASAEAGIREGSVAGWLRHFAALQPEAPAVIEALAGSRARSTTFAELDRLADRAAAGLGGAGVGPGDRMVLMVQPGRAFFALAFGLFRLGAVMVGVDPGMGVRRVRRALRECDLAGFAGTPKAHLARACLGWGGAGTRASIGTGGRLERRPDRGSDALPARVAARVAAELPRLGRAGLSRPAHCMGFEELVAGAPPGPSSGAVAAGSLAAILFTSGSTGAPKGVLYTHRVFHAQLDALRAAFSIRPGERELATFALFALFAPALGMTAVIPDMDFSQPGRADPVRLGEVIRTHRIDSVFGSPALLRRLTGPALHPRLAGVTRIVSAGAPVPADVIAGLRALAPSATIHTPYGATEALPVTSITGDEILTETRRLTDRGRGICVGRPLAGVEIQVIPVDDGAIPRWHPGLTLGPERIGELAVKSPIVAGAYLGRPDADALARIACDDGSVVHRMGDLGYRDRHGRLWLCGRKSQRVRGAQGDLYTLPCEAVFNTHAEVLRCALVGVETGEHEIPVLVVQPRRRLPRARRRALIADLQALGARHEHTRGIEIFLVHRRFPVDPRHNAKIGREALARWARRRIR